MKIGRNDPCPCGSGQKYKKCCFGKILGFPDLETATAEEEEKQENKARDEFLRLVKESFADKDMNSLEEANEYLGAMAQAYNDFPESNFLGLSPSQMEQVLNSVFSLRNNLFVFNCKDVDDLEEKVPFLKHSLYFLRKLKRDGEMKATNKGNLPRAFVRDLYYEFFSKERYARLPQKEDDLGGAVALRNVLDLGGIIKKRKGKFSLTKKGEDLLDHRGNVELFEEIFLTFANKWNWAYLDRCQELYMVQRSAVFNLYLLNQKCQEWISDKELGGIYLDAFPELVNELYPGFFTLEEEVSLIFKIRFLVHFCLPLGLVEIREEGKLTERKEFYRVTSFFKPATNLLKSARRLLVMNRGILKNQTLYVLNKIFL